MIPALSASAELYDPAAGTWSPTGALTDARLVSHGHPAAQRQGPGGRGVDGGGYLASAELYDPAAGTWSVTASLITARSRHTATLLPDGKVLAAGGENGSGYLASAELYLTDTTQHTITAIAGTGGDISPAGAVSVYGGANQTFTIAPNPDYYILDVMVDGASVGAVASYTFTNVTASHTIEAIFAPNPVITVNVTGNGTVTPGTTSVPYGTDLTFTITPDPGHYIAGMAVDGQSRTIAPFYTFTNITDNHTIEVVFAPNPVITVNVIGNGTVSPGTTSVPYGTDLTFTITPAAGHYIAGMAVDGQSRTIASSYTFTNITDNHTIEVVFAPNPVITVNVIGNGTVSPGTTSVPYGTDLTFTITPDPGHYIAGMAVDGQSRTIAPFYTFTDITDNHTIEVVFAPNPVITVNVIGNGTVTPGTTSVPYGTDLTFTITPAAGHYIAGMAVDGQSRTIAPSYTFTNITVNHTIEVVFAPNPVITVNVIGSGTVSPGTTSVPYGTDLTFTITPDPGHYIAGMAVDGQSRTIAPFYTFTNITDNHTIEVTFAPNPVITVNVIGNGTVTPGTTSVPYGTDLTFTITPDPGHYIAGMAVDGQSRTIAPSYTFTNVTDNHTIAVTFAPNPVITASVNGNGTISPAGAVSVAYGADQTFTITADLGYRLVQVLVDGTSAGLVTSYTFTNVTDDHTISATFAIDTHTIAASAGANGTIAPSGTVIVSHGAGQTFSITPAANYHVADVLVDGASVGALTSYTFTNVTTDHTISATFAIDTYTIAASAGANGIITPNGTVTVNHGANQTFSITASPDFHILDVLVDGASAGPVASYTFTNVTANHTIAATFAANVPGTWIPTGSLNTVRMTHTATLLPNGKVLVAGGYDGGSAYLASAELYDPAAGTWTPTGSLTGARYYHTATLLPDGKVLVAGGL